MRLKNTLTEQEKDSRKVKDAERSRKLYYKKKQQPDSKSSVFATPQVRGKLKKRVREALKGTKEQNMEVLNELLEENYTDPPQSRRSLARKSTTLKSFIRSKLKIRREGKRLSVLKLPNKS